MSAPRPDGRGNRSEVLAAVLSQTLAVIGTGMGNAQIADRAEGGLRIERPTGHPADFVDFFAHVGDEGTSRAKAAWEGRPGHRPGRGHGPGVHRGRPLGSPPTSTVRREGSPPPSSRR
ncbi:hypothetical protein [Streptomyces phaeolivaceus]|uniref:hypothetical protein n=1 Tax=Streptomyces phaeolivaceus TaxID=2653200 RepID=UPI001D0399A2|nr:hypothetical protein [Streptomyces phaeolivaceus]